MQFDGLWRSPGFLRFWAADTVSVFGSLITRIALPFTAILMLNASAFEMSLLVLADLVPSAWSACRWASGWTGCGGCR